MTSSEHGRTWPLVGRAAELDDLDELLSTVAGGQGVTVLLEGEAGVGKSSLVEALRGSARLLDVQLSTALGSSMRSWPFALLSEALLQGSSRTPLELELAGILDTLWAAPTVPDDEIARIGAMFADLLRNRGASRPWALVL